MNNFFTKYFYRFFNLFRYEKSAIKSVPNINPPKMVGRTIKQTPQVSSDAETLINQAVEEVSLELELKYKSDLAILKSKLNEKDDLIKNLQTELIQLKAVLETKEQTVKELITQVSLALSQSSPGTMSTVLPISDNVIDMDEVFVDPSIKGQENKMTSFINVTEVKGSSNVLADVSKLKKALKKF